MDTLNIPVFATMPYPEATTALSSRLAHYNKETLLAFSKAFKSQAQAYPLQNIPPHLVDYARAKIIFLHEIPLLLPGAKGTNQSVDGPAAELVSGWGQQVVHAIQRHIADA